MKKVKFIFPALISITLVLFCCYSDNSNDSGKIRPNVIFILVDDLGYTDLGCFGSDLFETPHIDKLAESGMVFTNAYSAAHVCSPTRASFMTGKPPVKAGLTEHIRGREFKVTGKHEVIPPENGTGLALEHVTIAELLKQEGYRTGIIGKWHLGGNNYSADKQGFDYVLAANRTGGPGSFFYPYRNTKPDLIQGGSEGEYLTDRLTDEAVKLINARKDSDFFLYMSYYSVHIPLQAKEELIEKYQKKIDGTNPVYHTNPIYAAMIETLDSNIGKLITCLEAENLLDNTLIMLTSDNGGLSVKEGRNTPATNNYPCREGKGFIYEGGIKVPLIVSWPGRVKPNSRSDVPAITYDYFTTISSVCGAKEDTPGSLDLSRIFLAQDVPDVRPIFWYAPHYSNQGGKPAAAVRKGQYKLIRYFTDSSYELYDLDKDMKESYNLIEEFPELTESLKKELENWLKENVVSYPVPNPEYIKPAN